VAEDVVEGREVDVRGISNCSEVVLADDSWEQILFLKVAKKSVIRNWEEEEVAENRDEVKQWRRTERSRVFSLYTIVVDFDFDFGEDNTGTVFLSALFFSWYSAQSKQTLRCTSRPCYMEGVFW
jgi:hypothetical protein